MHFFHILLLFVPLCLHGSISGSLISPQLLSTLMCNNKCRDKRGCKSGQYLEEFRCEAISRAYDTENGNQEFQIHHVNLTYSCVQKEMEMIHTTTCVKEQKRCGRLPRVPHSDVKFGGGNKATYTCRPGFCKCGDKTEITCLSSGHWEKPSECERYRWKKPRVPFIRLLPCGKQAKTELIIKGKPTARTAFYVKIKRIKDELLHAAIRFDADQTYRCVAFNTLLNDQWRQEIRTQTFPFQYRKTFNLRITLNDGIYKVVVDGIQLITYPDEEKGGLPDRISVKGAVSLDMVELLI